MFRDTFWEWMVFACLWLPLALLWASAFIDIIRRNDLSGWGIIGWMLLVLWLPLLGALIYFAFRPRDADASGGAYVSPAPAAAAAPSAADELKKLADLKAQGVLTEEEFEQQKARLLE